MLAALLALALADPSAQAREPPTEVYCSLAREHANLRGPVYDRYTRLLQEYREGEREAAVESLLAWPRPCVEAAAAAVQAAFLAGSEQRPCDVPCLRTAAIVQIELAHRRRVELRIQDDRELERARSLVAAFHAATGEGTFMAGFLVAAACLMQDAMRFHDSLPPLEEARRLAPEDTDIPLAIGSLHLEAGLNGGSTLKVGLRDAGRAPLTPARRELRLAEQALRLALQTAPGLAEAHLRLGHVLLLLERFDESERELRWVLDQGWDARDVLNARLLLGALFDWRGQLQQAVDGYRGAGRAHPRPRTAQLALAAALLRLGDRRGAAAAVREGLVPEASSHDPWIHYRLAVLVRLDRNLERLRDTLKP